jgi:hypothetical protein
VCALALALLPLSAGAARASDASAFARLVAARYNLDARHVVTTDIDFDGDLDVVVSTDRGFLIWVNDGAGRFTSETPKHHPIVDGHAPGDTWDGAGPSHDETIQSSVTSAPLTAEPERAPPSLSLRSDVLNDVLLHSGRARGGSVPRAPPSLRLR